MKKGQLLEQPLFYVFILVAAALFLIFGIKAVFDLKERAELAELATSIRDLDNVIETYYNFDSGSSRKIDIRFPSKVKSICFTEHNPQSLPQSLDPTGSMKKLFTMVDENMFIFPQSAFTNNAFKIDYISIKEDPLCFQIQGSLKALITNVGETVEISKNI